MLVLELLPLSGIVLLSEDTSLLALSEVTSDPDDADELSEPDELSELDELEETASSWLSSLLEGVLSGEEPEDCSSSCFSAGALLSLTVSLTV